MTEIADARGSPVARAQLDRRTADALGLPEDCIPTFLERLVLFDRRTREIEERGMYTPKITKRLMRRL